MMIFCMLLTQNTKNLILKSQYSVPNLISELQSDKIKANGPEILDEGISQFFFYLKQKHACIKLVYLSDGWRYYKEGIVHPWDTTTHCRSAIPVWQYLKLNTYLQESQQTPPPSSSRWPHFCLPCPSQLLLTMRTQNVSSDGLHCPPLSSSRVHHLQVGMEYYKVHWVGSGRVGKVVEGGVRPLGCPNDALCLKRVAVFQRWHFFYVLENVS